MTGDPSNMLTATAAATQSICTPDWPGSPFWSSICGVGSLLVRDLIDKVVT